MAENKKKVEDVDGRYGPHPTGAVPGINNPEIELPAYNPPVPNRAWTAMRKEMNEKAGTEGRTNIGK